MGAVFSKLIPIVFLLTTFVFTAYANPDIQHWEAKSGANVLFVQSNQLPMLDIRIVFDAGSARDGELSGLAYLTNSLLSEGAGGYTAQQLAEKFESVGAEFESDSLRDMAYVGLRTLTEEKYLIAAIENLSLVLKRPEFSQQAFDRQLSRLKVSVQARKQSPKSIAELAFYRAIYGKHPYATPVGGTENSLGQLTKNNVINFYQKHYVANNAVVVIVGAIERKQAEDMVDELFIGLSKGQKAESLPVVKDLTSSKLIQIDYPSAQSHIFIGQPGMKRGDKDYFSLYVGNHPFGGSGFGSRLVKEIREDKGLAYSVYSYFSPMRARGPFMLGMQTRSEKTEQAIKILNDELQKYVKSGPESDELAASISNLTGSVPLNIDSNSKLLGYVAMIGFYDLPHDYLETLSQNIENVTQSYIVDAFSRRIHPEKMVTVIVGRKNN